MNRRLRNCLLGALSLCAVIALLLVAALRDNPARPAVGERRQTAEIEATIHYFVGGPKGGPVVALIPSFARSASDFNELVDDLNAAGYRTLAIQPRGIEGSDPAASETTLHSYAADVASLLRAEEISDEVVVVGHAFGNRVARTFATDFPSLTRALILLAAGGNEPTPTEAGNAILKALVRILPDDTRRKAIQYAFFAEGHAVPDSWLRGWYPMAGFAQNKASVASDYARWGSAGRAPILVLQPEEDRVAGRGGPLLKKRFPDRVELREIPRAGHAILPEQPERVTREILDYLSALEKG